MAQTLQERLAKLGKRASGTDIESIVGKFNKDFNKQTNQIIDLMKFNKEKSIQISKQTRLNTIAQPQITKSRSVAKGRSFGGQVIGGTSSNVEVVKELQEVNKNLGHQEQAMKADSKIQKKNLRSGIIQAKVIETVLGKAKTFFIDGPSMDMQQLNAIENVERAIRNQEPIQLDSRSLLEKIIDSAATSNEVVGKIAEKSMTSEQAQEKIAQTVAEKLSGRGTTATDARTKAQNFAGKLGDKVSGASFSGAGASAGAAAGVAASLVGKFGETVSDLIKKFKIPVDQEVEEKIKSTASSYATSLNENVGAFMKKHFSKGKATLKSNAMGIGFGAFADFIDLGFSQVLKHPLKSLSLGSKSFKFAMNNFMDANMQGRFITAATLFGTLPAVVITGLNPVLKAFRFMFGDRGSISEIVGGFTKSMGKKFGKMKKSLAAKGAGMITFMGTAMSAAMAFIPVLITAAIAAWPFILGALIVAAVAGIGYYVYQNWDTVKESFQTYIVDPLVDMFTWVVDSVSGLFSSIGEKIEATMRASGSIGTAVADFMFGEQSDNPAATDKTQQLQTKTNIGKTLGNKSGTKDNSGEQLQLSKEMLAELKNREAAAQTSIPPSSNIDDVATYIVTQ